MIDALLESLLITGFVVGMMLLIEYFHVLTQGRWSEWLGRRGLRHYLLAALLGGIPGCLGAFTAVAMYSHGLISFGAVVAAMIASSGDEAFVMLALVPRSAAALIGILVVLGVAAGYAVDALASRTSINWPQCKGLVIHAHEPLPQISAAGLLRQWKDCSAARGIMSATLAVFCLALAAGRIGPDSWNWVRVSMIAVSTLSLWVVATLPDHVIEEHFWKHAARHHAPRVFLWTLGALLVSRPLAEVLNRGEFAGESRWLLLLAACLIGLIPESGPHLILVTLYARDALPFSILLANSIVQDGHGMLPMLAHSRRIFAAVKAVNFLIALAAGTIAIGLGF